MQQVKKTILASALFGAMSVASVAPNAQPLALDIEIPQLNVAEYHKPYVAVWLEDDARKSTQVALWYQIDKRENKGQEWLKDLRQWWRRVGRGMQLPYDGLTSATKGPGSHQLTVDLSKGDFKDLAPGNYKLRVEAVREVGGRENVNIPITLPIDSALLPITTEGKTELGAISLSIK